MGRYEKAMEAASAFNKNNYTMKVETLKNKLTDEYKLWSLKRNRHPNRFQDVERDVNVLKGIMGKIELSQSDKATIDRLCNKYNVS